ncbi:hypothetical protein ISG33_00460 [Glaciecola sp. MH2013]|uniref:hypothetical protein n=1 Tax=Glaciecola sp. MH2013 TaxID=2785524 RepID=UPI0018A07530|nr:hypothetical protein [Glaciecola sp. MH2013]MBF7071868.1 hypothetical protein [Glaciecola sp. MH2013]
MRQLTTRELSKQEQTTVSGGHRVPYAINPTIHDDPLDQWSMLTSQMLLQERSIIDKIINTDLIP